MLITAHMNRFSFVLYILLFCGLTEQPAQAAASGRAPNPPIIPRVADLPPLPRTPRVSPRGVDDAITRAEEDKRAERVKRVREQRLKAISEERELLAGKVAKLTNNQPILESSIWAFVLITMIFGALGLYCFIVLLPSNQERRPLA
jgi:hypothetical protein